jgi:hypothetical protein
MSLTMGCTGKGSLIVRGPLSAGEERCSNASLGRGTFAGYYWSHVPGGAGGNRTLMTILEDRENGCRLTCT